MNTTHQTSSELSFTVNGVSFKMIKVEGGTFTVGVHPNQENEDFRLLEDFEFVVEDERPAHSVTLSSYHIAETEVTQALWRAVTGDNPSRC